MDQHTLRFSQLKCWFVLMFNGQKHLSTSHTNGSDKVITYLHGYQHLVFGRAEVIALRQEDFTEGSFAQLPLQNDVSPLDMLDH